MYSKIKIFENFSIDTYSIMMFLGIAFLVWYFVYILEKKNKYSHEKVNSLLIYLAIGLGGALIGALLFDFLVHKLENPNAEFGGITFLGGLIGGVVIFSLLINFFMIDERKNILHILNLIIPGVIFAHAVGRIGCFLSGCCFGKPTEFFLGVVYPSDSTPAQVFPNEDRTGSLPLHPTQLYEAFFLFVLFTLMFIFKNKKVKNYYFSIYLICYAIFRFAIEFLRADDRGNMLFGISPSQYLSILLLITGVVILILPKIKKEKKLE